MIGWIRPLDNSGTITGINDGSIYTFKERKYESLAREILQNSIDERLNSNLPVKVEFSVFQYPTANLPDINTYHKLFVDGLEYWKNDSQENAKEFFSNAIQHLTNSSMKVLRISDFNTNGVIGSQTNEIKSSKDITPWYNLIKSEGSSSKGSTQGGSFGIGKNATFANSALRTVIYSTHDKFGIMAHEGLAKLATIYKNNNQYAPKSFYGYNNNGHSCAIRGAINIDPSFDRDEYGTDIFVLGFEAENDWKLRMIISILSDFIIPIYRNELTIIIDGEEINSSTLQSIFDYYLDKSRNLRSSQRNEIQIAYNYFQVITSAETLEFKKNFEDYGDAVLKVLYNPDFDRRVMRTRETGMNLFTKGHISQSIGFSGIVSLEGQKLNKLFRKMENPAHTAWSADNVDSQSDKRIAKKLLSELDRWIRVTVLENAYDTELESQEVVGLGEFLPSLFLEPEAKTKHESETLSDKVNQITEYKTPRNDFLSRTDPFKEETLGQINHKGDGSTVFTGTKDTSTTKGGTGKEATATLLGDGETRVYKKISAHKYKTRFIKNEENHLLILTPSYDIKNASVSVNISGETSPEPVSIISAVHRNTKSNFEISKNKIILGNITQGTNIPILITARDIQDFALEVELYENKTQ